MTDLRTMLKSNGLKVSGNKPALIQRLLENAPEAMREAAADTYVYRCTQKGWQLAEQYLTDEAKKLEATKKQVLESLQRRELPDAIYLVADYESRKVFPRGIGIDWSNYNSQSEFALLRVIFEMTPEILKGIEANRLDELRVAAGMMQLWGTSETQEWLPTDFITGIRLDAPTACQMLIFHANHIRRMEVYREIHPKTVQVRAIDDGSTCAACRKMHRRKYPLAEVPELPYPRCRSEMGCRCTTVLGDFR